MSNLETIKHKLIDAVRILHACGVFELNYGHVSCRVPGRKEVCMLGHLHDVGDGMPLTEVRPEHFILVDPDTGEWEGNLEPPGEEQIHTAVYRNRQDVQAVVHCHPELPVILSLAGKPVQPFHNHGKLFSPSVPLFEDCSQIDHPEIAQRMVDTLGNAPAIVLQGHGAVSVGGSVEEAVIVMTKLDACAKRQYLAYQIGADRPLFTGEPSPLDPERIRNEWMYYRNQLAKAGGHERGHG